MFEIPKTITAKFLKECTINQLFTLARKDKEVSKEDRIKAYDEYCKKAGSNADFEYFANFSIDEEIKLDAIEQYKKSLNQLKKMACKKKGKKK